MFTFVMKPCIPKTKIISETSYYLIGLEFLFVYSFSITNHDSSPYMLLKASLRIVTILMAFCFIFHFLFVSCFVSKMCKSFNRKKYMVFGNVTRKHTKFAFISIRDNVKIMPNMETPHLVVSVDLFSQITDRYESSKLFQVLLFTQS